MRVEPVQKIFYVRACINRFSESVGDLAFSYLTYGSIGLKLPPLLIS